MGSVCMYCGCRHGYRRGQRRLEFHHTRPRTWITRDVSTRDRMYRYIRDWKAGVLGLACPPCNKKYGRPTAAQIEEETNAVPF